ncbi:hypothetical protein ACDT12_13000, partial [Staphylococcus aureus]
MEKAFDMVWREGLIARMMDMGIRGRMIRWIDHSILNVEQGDLYELTRTKEYEYRKTTNQMDSNQMFID